mgnify:FL=1
MSVVTANIRKVRFPRRNLAFVRNVGPYAGHPELFERLFKEVVHWMDVHQIPKGPEMEAIALYLDDPERVPEEKQRINVGFTVPDGVQSAGRVLLMDLPEGDYLVGSFELDPNEYGEAWNEMMAYLQEENIRPREIMYESYKNDPNEYPGGKHLVDICILV